MIRQLALIGVTALAIGGCAKQDAKAIRRLVELGLSKKQKRPA
jgi:hypothetical protein